MAHQFLRNFLKLIIENSLKTAFDFLLRLYYFVLPLFLFFLNDNLCFCEFENFNGYAVNYAKNKSCSVTSSSRIEIKKNRIYE